MGKVRKSKAKPRQEYLRDGDETMEPERIEAIDEAVDEYCLAVDDIADGKERKEAATETILDAMEAAGVSTYLANRGDTVLRVEITAKRRLSAKRVKPQEPAEA